jgi:hypothetical protein
VNAPIKNNEEQKEAKMPELDISWQPYQGKVLVYDLKTGEFTVVQTPSLS